MNVFGLFFYLLEKSQMIAVPIISNIKVLINIYSYLSFELYNNIYNEQTGEIVLGGVKAEARCSHSGYGVRLKTDNIK